MSESAHELRDYLLNVVHWAEAKRMFGENSVEPDYNEAKVRELFSGVGIHSATETLQDRQIAYIGINEANESIVIFTQKALRVKDVKTFEVPASARFRIEVRHAYQLSSGTIPPPPTLTPPFVTHRGIYTCGSSASIANEQGAGTLGFLARNGFGQIFGVSNNHVFAGANYAEIGIPILTPGQADISANSLDPFVMGHLSAASPLVDGNPNIVATSSNLDAAIIAIRDEARVSSMQRDVYDTPQNAMQILPNMNVEKIGRTTGRTFGQVVAHFVTPQFVRCHIPKLSQFKHVPFVDVWGVAGSGGNTFSKPGDSGSLVTTTNSEGLRVAVGIVFAGNENLSFILPVQKVLSKFGLQLIGGHNI